MQAHINSLRECMCSSGDRTREGCMYCVGPYNAQHSPHIKRMMLEQFFAAAPAASVAAATAGYLRLPICCYSHTLVLFKWKSSTLSLSHFFSCYYMPC